MFDDLFSLVNDWLPEELDLNLDDVSSNPFDDANSFLMEEECMWDNSDSLVDIETNSSFEDNYFPATEETTVFDYFFEQPFYYPYEETWNVSEFDGIGDPFVDADYWQRQEGGMSCAVVAQRGVLEAITGVDFSEAELCEFAEAQGWFDPSTGTSPQDASKILNHLGVPTESYYDATLSDIADALERGDKVIVGLDAMEISDPLRDEFGNPLEQLDAGHAVWVTGIDQLPDGSVKLILNDSGNQEGQMAVVDAIDFVNAWSDFGRHMIVAQTNVDSDSVIV